MGAKGSPQDIEKILLAGVSVPLLLEQMNMGLVAYENESVILQFRKSEVRISGPGHTSGCWQGPLPPGGSGGALGLLQGGCCPHSHVPCFSL